MAEDIVKEAREALQASYDFDKDNRSEAIEDLRFRANFQWSDEAKRERAGRPTITINRTDQFIHQVVNPIRQNMPTIKVEPDGDDQSDMAEIVNGLMRRIQYNSSASHVYASAVEHMATCGIGWFRVVNDYLSDDTFDQEILIKRVFNPLSIYPDPAAKEPDRSDMEWCLVSEMWPIESFKKKWPGKSVTGIDSPANGASLASGFSWGTSDEIRVAEYWKRKRQAKKMVQLSTGQVVDFALVSKVDPQLAELMKPHIVNERSVDGYSVESVMVSGAEQLEEAYKCPCKWIPIIPVIGAEIPLEIGVYRYGLLRFQREPQQLHNYFMSVAAEQLGQQPKAPYMVPFKAIEKYKNVWDNVNRIPTPYLPYSPVPELPNSGIIRQEPPALSQGMIAMAQMLQDDMKAATGQYDASLGNRSNETSGVAIGQRQQQSDNATFHFTDNLEHGLEHLGRVLLDMIPQVYDTQRTLRIRAADDTEKTVTVNQSLGGYDGEEMVRNDLSKASFSNVRVVLGPSFASKRAEAQQTLVALAQAVPAIAEVGPDILVRQFDFDGAEELAERLKKAVPQQLLGDNEGAQPQPDPLQQQAVQTQLEEAAAKTQKTLADARKSQAQAEGQEIENQLTVQQAHNGMHPTQQHPMQDKVFDAEQSAHDAERSDRHRYEDRQWSVEDQRRQSMSPSAQ